MAGLIQDSNTNATYGHSAGAMKKGRLGRKPLGAKVKKNISKASDNDTRKVLSDISNLNRNKSRTATKKKNRKLTPASDEQFDENDIAEEGYEHDHEECMKAQRWERSMDIDYVIETLGLPHGCLEELSSLKRPETPPPSPLSFLKMMEVPILDGSTERFDFSPPESPDDVDDDQFWEDRYDCISLKLLDSPELVKH